MLTYYVNLKNKGIDNIPKDNHVEFYGDIFGLIEHECTEYTLDILDLYRKEKPIEKVIEDLPNYTSEEDKLRLEKYTQINEINTEIDFIKEWYKEHDYYVNKVFIGEWDKDDERYVEYLKERKVKRDRLDELTLTLNEL